MSIRKTLALIFLAATTLGLTSQPAFAQGGPNITKQPPATVVVKPGYQARLTMQARGKPPVKYQWFFNNGSGAVALSNTQQISGVATASLSIGQTSVLNVGNYYVQVTDITGTNTSNISLVLLTGNVANITVQPVSTSAVDGKSAHFSVVATIPNARPTYQWQVIGGNNTPVNISGAGLATYTINSVNATMNKNKYRVVVSGIATSTNATLTVTSSTGGITITKPPVNQVVASGATAKFTVAATGSPTLSYQWNHEGTPLVNGGNITGATSTTLSVKNAGAGNTTGNYSVLISNNGVDAPVLSGNVTLTLAP
jgi:hypothetical protein